MSFFVQVVDGPAAGWSYYTGIEPDPVIAVAPLPGRPGEFFRAIISDAPWPDQHLYEREPIEPAASALGERPLEYRLVVE
jgi:hypothetical protein